MPFTVLNGCKLHYEIRGQGPAMLFVHGLGSCLADWEYQFDEFSKTHTVIAADLRGHGDSEKPPGPYSIEMFAADQLALLQTLNVNEADVVGLSLGGAVAFQLAIAQPSLVRRLIIVNSFPDFVPKNWRERLAVWQKMVMLRPFSFATLGKSVVKRMFPNPDDDRVKATFLQRYVRNDRASYFASLRALFRWGIAKPLEELKCAVLVMAADNDYSFIPRMIPVSAKEAYVKTIPGAKLVVIPNARHATPMERPIAFNRALRFWLESTTPQRKQKAVA